MADTQDTGTATTDAGESHDTTAGASTGAPGTDSTTNTDATGAAAEVEYTFEAPEGIELDQAQVDEFKAIAKELKLSGDDAKKIAAVAINREAARREAFVKQVEAWGQDVAKDPVLGKPEAQAAMRKIVDAHGTPELKSLLNSTGLGNHPELARFVHSISKAMSEDAIHGKAAGETAPANAASVLYDTHNAKA